MRRPQLETYVSLASRRRPLQLAAFRVDMTPARYPLTGAHKLRLPIVADLAAADAHVVSRPPGNVRIHPGPVLILEPVDSTAAGQLAVAIREESQLLPHAALRTLRVPTPAVRLLIELVNPRRFRNR